MQAELDGEAERHGDAGDVGEEPARVADDLEDRGGVVVFETGLVEREARVTERVVHEDEDLAIIDAVRGGEADAAGEVFGDVGAGVAVVREFQQRERERQIVAGEAERDGVAAAGVLEALWFEEERGDEIRAEGAVGADEIDEGGRHVALVLFVGDGLRGSDELRAGAGGGVRRRGVRIGAAEMEGGIGIEVADGDAEREGGVLGGPVFGEDGFGDRGNAAGVGIGGVDDGEFDGAVALGVVFRFVVGDAQVVFVLKETGEKFAEEENDEAAVDEVDAGLAPREFETEEMGGDEIGEQESAEGVAAGENREGEVADGPEDRPAVEVFFLHGPDADVHLVKRRGEDEDDRQRDEGDGEFERGEDVAKIAQERAHKEWEGWSAIRGRRRAG